MRFVVCGAGAIGGVLGGQLAKAGFAVLFIDKIPEHVAAINTHGLRLKGVHGAHTLAIPAVLQASAVDFHADDVLILAVKSFHCAAAAAELRRATTLEVPIFCAQNSVANENIAARYFQHVNGLMVLIGAKRLVPGEVVHTGNGPVGIGTYPVGLSQAAHHVAAALQETDLPIYTTEHIGRAKWHKLLLNLNNATLGLTGLTTQEATADAAVRLWMADVWEEGASVLQAAGIAYEGPPGFGAIEDCVRELRDSPMPPYVPVDDEYTGRSSLWQDLYHRRGQVEAEYLNGEIVRLGRQYGIPTPYNSLLLDLTTAMAATRALPGTHTVQQLRECLRHGPPWA
jgi:2-dehydropantoate 2-reductase